MAYHPYPNPDRARRQITRHDTEVGPAAPARPASPLELQLAQGLAAIGRSLRPMRDALVRAGAPEDAPLAAQMLHVAVPQARAVLAESAPAALVMADAVRGARRPV